MGEVPEVAELLAAVVAEVGGVQRTGQEQMAQAVAATLRGEQGHLLVQAGTGTGKSLAYAVPAARQAVTTQEPVVVATATLALQRQLAVKDLPALVAGLGEQLGRVVSFAVLKGRSNYLCRDRLERGNPAEPDQAELFESPTSRLGKQAKRVSDWAELTTTGDRDDLPAPVDGRVWSAVSVSARECVGAANCQFGTECFVEVAREECRKADVVITNHAMLAVHLQGDASVIPAHGAVIVDEAHELVDRVTAALTRELSESTVVKAATAIRRFAPDGAVEDLIDAAGYLSDVLAGEVPSRLRELPGELIVALTALRDNGHQLLSSTRPESGEDPAAATDRTRARSLLTAVHDLAADLLLLDATAVSWITAPTGKPPALYLAPLSVRELLSERLFAETPVVLTSATLAVGGDISAFAATAGAPAESVALDVGSPFDYRRQAILYCAARLPRPGREGPSPESLRELAELIEAAGGRTLALFSSWRAVDAAAEFLRGRLPAELPVLRAMPGDPVAPLVRQFAADSRSSLLGTMSLWQGVDVPGESCALVVIDRIPFPRPDEPVVSARQEAINQAGGNGFTSVSVPRAALLLAQGAGRLIRSQSDRGVVAILDPRFATAGYAPQLRRTLPPFWYTTSGETVRSSLRRLAESFAGPLAETGGLQTSATD
ncbi:MAG: ATP-dependent DNA helicase [Candidatus Nanopelagicales bacterium]